MKRNKKFALLALTLVLATAASVRLAAEASAQSGAAASDTQKTIKAKFEVLKMTYTSIQVRSLIDQKALYTFTYSDQIRDAMQSLYDQGGYQYGDKVVIWYQPGANVLLRIKGKPSKAI